MLFLYLDVFIYFLLMNEGFPTILRSQKNFQCTERNEMERNTKKCLEETTPHIHVLIIEITVAIVYTTCFNIQEF